MKARLLIIGMCIILLIGGVYIVGTTLTEEGKGLPVAKVETKLIPSIPTERGVFFRSDKALEYQQMPASQRGLSSYQNNRAYPGAPPSISHALISEKGIGGKNCLQCHQNGGYVDQFKAFAPVTPHPEYTNCKQCHVPQKTAEVFKKSNWEKLTPPKIHQVAFEGAPPRIPHDLDLKNNCLSCHAGPGAPIEIRVSHPERVNCRQCHVPINVKDIFIKPDPKKEKVFTRPDKTIGSIQPVLEDAKVLQISEWIQSNQ